MTDVKIEKESMRVEICGVDVSGDVIVGELLDSVYEGVKLTIQYTNTMVEKMLNKGSLDIFYEDAKRSVRYEFDGYIVIHTSGNSFEIGYELNMTTQLHITEIVERRVCK